MKDEPAGTNVNRFAISAFNVFHHLLPNRGTEGYNIYKQDKCEIFGTFLMLPLANYLFITFIQYMPLQLQRT